MTGRLIAPAAPEFVALFDTFEVDAFQLETLQTYGAAGEDADAAAFLAGQSVPPDPSHEAWLDMVRRNTTAGRTMRRVHLLTEPLTDYARYEVCWPYALCTSAGEDIRLITSPESSAPGDWWLFDSRHLYRQHHDPQGRWLGTEPVDDPAAIEAARRLRDTMWPRATRWADYIAARPGLAARIPTAA